MTLHPNFARFFLLPSLLLGTMGCTKTHVESFPLAGKIEVQRFRLENGLKVLIVEDHSSPTFAYQTWFHVGSKNEKKGKTGLAHLFEHMMFKETAHLKDGEFDRMLEQAGAEGENAFTSRDFTAYVQEMPASQLDLIARLEADRMVNLKVDGQALKTETAVVQNERRFRNENSPDGTMYQEIFGLAFDKHPYHWPVIGYQADLDSMTPEDALSFYRTFYSPNHATIIVAGDVKASQVIDTIRKYYGDLKAQAEPERPSPDDVAITTPRLKTMKLNIQVQKLMMAYRIPGASNADRSALNVLRGVLTGGKSSRLARALINAGVVTDVDSFDLDDEHGIANAVLVVDAVFLRDDVNRLAVHGNRYGLGRVDYTLYVRLGDLTVFDRDNAGGIK